MESELFLLYNEFGVIVVLVLGLFIGSFLNVCIYRIPITYDLFDEEFYPTLKSVRDTFYQKSQKTFSITFPPRSVCPHCQRQLRWYHNIPVVSWLMLGGRCAFCTAPIGIRYPLVELCSALAAVTSVLLFGFSLSAVVSYLILASFIVITCIDYDHFMIPDVITFPLMILGTVLVVINHFHSFYLPPFATTITESGLGVLAGAGSLYVVAKAYLIIRNREGLGLGDVKLLAVTGIFFGYQGAFFTIFIGSLLGSVFGITMIIFGKKSAAQEIPFGPYLCVANILYLFAATDVGQMLIAKASEYLT